MGHVHGERSQHHGQLGSCAPLAALTDEANAVLRRAAEPGAFCDYTRFWTMRRANFATASAAPRPAVIPAAETREPMSPPPMPSARLAPELQLLPPIMEPLIVQPLEVRTPRPPSLVEPRLPAGRWRFWLIAASGLMCGLLSSWVGLRWKLQYFPGIGFGLLLSVWLVLAGWLKLSRALLLLLASTAAYQAAYWSSFSGLSS